MTASGLSGQVLLGISSAVEKPFNNLDFRRPLSVVGDLLLPGLHLTTVCAGKATFFPIPVDR